MFQSRCTEELDRLQKSLKKVECDVTILNSQWNSIKQAIDEFGEQLAPTQVSAEALTQKLAEMETNEANIWAALQETREGLHELRSGSASEKDSIGVSS